MKVGRIRHNDRSEFAVQNDDASWTYLADLGVEAETTRDVIAATQRGAAASRMSTHVREPTLLCPIVSPSKILAIGLNYLDHIRETNKQVPDYPIVFAKFPSALNDPFGDIVVDPDLTEKADYEVELAVIIGKTVKGISPERASEAVYGYAIANDVSARDWQRTDGQFSRSKSFDSFCPLGPWITTADEVPDPNNLRIASWVNGEKRQESNTREMIFDVSHLIWYIARGMTLFPGDVILTGTPHGVGFAMDPPRYLVAGDLVSCQIADLGRIENRVTAPRSD